MSADDKAAAAWNDYVSQQQQEKIEELERQLNAANERIKQLEDNRTVAAANSFANMLAYEDAIAKIKRLEEALRRIANQDYRGNRSTESQIAAEALKEAKP